VRIGAPFSDCFSDYFSDFFSDFLAYRITGEGDLGKRFRTSATSI